MNKVLFQADDYGITPAVSAGIRKGIKEGIIRNTGIFINMPWAEEELKNIEGYDVCLGIDINYLCGKPVTDPDLIPHLVDENGNFIHSGHVLKNHKIVSSTFQGLVNEFDVDPFPYDEIYLETENQVKKFIELTGKKPRYLHPHSLISKDSYQAELDVAKKYDIPYSFNILYNYRDLPGTFDEQKGNSLQDQISVDVEDILLNRALCTLKEGETAYYICHAGYVDAELFKHTSCTLRRARDLEGMLSQKVRKCLEDHHVELVTYDDIK